MNLNAFNRLSPEQIQEYIENADGNPVAGALFALTDAVAEASYVLGVRDAITPMGALEMLASEVKNSSEVIAEGLRQIADNMPEGE